MISKEKIERINALARKKKAEGLSPEEQAEQQALRKEYLAAIRGNLKSQLDNIRFVDDKAPESYSPEEKAHVEALSDKLGREYEAQKDMGNPAKPEGKAGLEMVETMNEHHAPLTDWALGYIDFHTDDHVLDVGCGGGAALAKISTMVPDGKLIGVDYSPVSVEASRKHNQMDLDSGKLDVILASVSDLPFDNDVFDVAVTFESHYFWPSLADDIKSVYRVIKPGGKLLLASEIYQYDGLDAKALANVQKYNLNNLSKAEFETLFVDAGFKEVAIHTKEGTDWLCVEGVK